MWFLYTTIVSRSSNAVTSQKVHELMLLFLLFQGLLFFLEGCLDLVFPVGIGVLNGKCKMELPCFHSFQLQPAIFFLAFERKVLQWDRHVANLIILADTIMIKHVNAQHSILLSSNQDKLLIPHRVQSVVNSLQMNEHDQSCQTHTTT